MRNPTLNNACEMIAREKCANCVYSFTDSDGIPQCDKDKHPSYCNLHKKRYSVALADANKLFKGG